MAARQNGPAQRCQVIFPEGNFDGQLIKGGNLVPPRIIGWQAWPDLKDMNINNDDNDDLGKVVVDPYAPTIVVTPFPVYARVGDPNQRLLDVLKVLEGPVLLVAFENMPNGFPVRDGEISTYLEENGVDQTRMKILQLDRMFRSEKHEFNDTIQIAMDIARWKVKYVWPEKKTVDASGFFKNMKNKIKKALVKNEGDPVKAAASLMRGEESL